MSLVVNTLGLVLNQRNCHNACLYHTEKSHNDVDLSLESSLMKTVSQHEEYVLEDRHIKVLEELIANCLSKCNLREQFAHCSKTNLCKLWLIMFKCPNNSIDEGLKAILIRLE